MKNKKRNIVFFGSIGVGKTTIGKEIEKQINNAIFMEETLEENPYFANYYNETNKTGFHSTIAMLLIMLKNYNKNEYEINIFDNGVEELIVFATVQHQFKILDDTEFSIYKKLYNEILNLLPKTDLFVYFYCDYDEQIRRINKRGRKEEANLDLEFLKELNKEYEKFYNNLDTNKKIKINTNEKIDYELIINQITK